MTVARKGFKQQDERGGRRKAGRRVKHAKLNLERDARKTRNSATTSLTSSSKGEGEGAGEGEEEDKAAAEKVEKDRRRRQRQRVALIGVGRVGRIILSLLFFLHLHKFFNSLEYRFK